MRFATAAVRGAGRRGLGVGCQASGFDCGSFCPYRVFRFGTRVTKRSRLRWLSERGCLESARTDQPGMLKWVPDPVCSMGRWPHCARSSCRVGAWSRSVFFPVAGVAGRSAGFLWEGLPAAFGFGPSAQDAPPTRKEIGNGPRPSVVGGRTKFAEPPAPLTTPGWNDLQHPPMESMTSIATTPLR